MSIALPTAEAIKDFSDVEKLRLHALLRERKEQRKRAGIYFYRPHKGQHLFHTCGFRYRLVRVGNRWGKSLAGAAEDVAFLLGERPWYDEGTTQRTVGLPPRPTKGLLICQDWEKSQELFTNQYGDAAARGKLFQLLPEDKVTNISKNHSGVVARITVKGLYGESALYIDTCQSFKSNTMSMESSDFDWVHVDEPIPEAMWTSVSRGLVDRGGSAFFTCTLLSEPWISDFFLPDMRENLDDGVPFENGQKWCLGGSMYDNPFLDPANIKEFEESLSEDEAACRIYGIPMSMSGTIYREFSFQKHVYYDTPKGWQGKADPPLDYSIKVAIDPHPRTPTAVLFAATAPTGEVFFFDELFMSGTIDEIAIQIKLRLHNRNVVWILCDPLGFIESPIDGRSMADVFIEHGLNVEKSPKEPSFGILQVKEALKTENFLFFSSDCRRTLFEFNHYIWSETRPDKPKDENDHQMENLYRMVLTGLEHVEWDENDNHIIPFSTLATARFSIPGEKPRVPKWDPSVRYK